jgi:glyoxylase-like metal-dependent hydrolase (beta-lactamase superfamily II)
MKVVRPGVYFLELEFGQAYLWDWGEGLTLVDTGITGSATSILESVASLGRSAAVIRGEQPPIPPVLEDFERPIAEAVMPRVPQARRVRVDREVDDGDRRRAIESLARQAELEFDVACFGHGAPLVGNAGAKIPALTERT